MASASFVGHLVSPFLVGVNYFLLEFFYSQMLNSFDTLLYRNFFQASFESFILKYNEKSVFILSLDIVACRKNGAIHCEEISVKKCQLIFDKEIVMKRKKLCFSLYCSFILSTN